MIRDPSKDSDYLTIESLLEKTGIDKKEKEVILNVVYALIESFIETIDKLESYKKTVKKCVDAATRLDEELNALRRL